MDARPTRTALDGSARRRPTRSAGFTLVELLISLVLFGIVISAALNMLMSQRRLADVATSSISLQQNVRAAVDLLSSELRTIPDGSVLTGTRDSMVVRYPYRWGLICAAAGGGSPEPHAEVYLPTSDPLFSSVEQAGVAVRDSDGTWAYWDDTDAPWEDSLHVESTVTCREGPGASVEAGDTAEASYRRWTDYETYTGAEAAQGDQVIAYTLITYRFDDSVFEPGSRALYRVTSAGAQELAGNFADDAGFEYVLDDGNVFETLPVGQEDDVARIRVRALGAVTSQSGGDDGQLSYDAIVDVHLRNSG